MANFNLDARVAELMADPICQDAENPREMAEGLALAEMEASESAKPEKAPAKPKAAKKAKGKGAAKPAPKAKPDRFKAAEAAAKALQSALPKARDAANDAEYHFSGLAHNLPSASDIEKGEALCKRMIEKDLAQYRAALKGQLPNGPFDGSPIDLTLQTHAGYKGKYKALRAMIDAGDLAGLEAWNGGLGIRMNSSSSKPLGRFHQAAMIALRAKGAAKAKRQAGRAAKAAPVDAPEGEGEGAQA
jgi:hypothetical protein